jgi:hypothetical protein
MHKVLPQVDPNALADLRDNFLKRTPGFTNFSETTGAYHEQERGYKDELAQLLISATRPYQVIGADTATDGALLGTIIDVLRMPLSSMQPRRPQNLLRWQDLDKLQRVDAAEQAAFDAALRDLLFGDRLSPDRLERFNQAVWATLQHHLRGNPYAFLRGFPTLLLMLHNPDQDIFVRTDLFSALTQRLVGRNLLENRMFDAGQYREVLDFASLVRSDLEEAGWQPRDMIDVQSFLWSAGQPEPDNQQFWVFQANPKQYDLRSELAELDVGDEDEWFVSRYASEMRPGDMVVLYESGPDAAVLAVGELTSAPYQGLKFGPAGRIGGSPDEQVVRYRYTEILAEPISRGRLLASAELQGMQVLRAPQGTNFRVSPAEWKALQQLIAESRAQGATSEQRYFKIAPGEQGEFWTECRDGDFICIGWDELGDLSAYPTREALRASRRALFVLGVRTDTPCGIRALCAIPQPRLDCISFRRVEL